MSLYTTLRPALFMLPPEQAHRAAILALQSGMAPRSGFVHPSLATTVAGISFANPLGLSAGFDKNAECFNGTLAAGFGHVEIGTVTPRPQLGNPRPRLFRLQQAEAVINRLGFNNEGMEAAAARLAVRGNAQGIIGGNIGKNKDSDDAVADYISGMRMLYPVVDYITANISSPNTPGLRALQATEELVKLVKALHEKRRKLIDGGEPYRPIFVKIAPDCTDELFEAIAHVALEQQLDGLIVSNTTTAREAVSHLPHGNETGGLSGKPLFAKSTEALRTMYRHTQGRIPLIGVGGVSSGADAYAKIRAGASLVQLYTALIYQGFGMVERLNRELVDLLARDGFKTVAEAVGTEA